jgi:diguanylate cyclase (GGDEF)-like protein
MRPADLVARYGGEEFMMLLPQTPRRGAEQISIRVLERVKNLGIYHADCPPNHRVSVSIGIACHDAIQDACGAENHCDCSTTRLVLAADRALYCAKAAGRGRAILSELNEVSPQDPSRSVPQTLHRSDTQASSGYRQRPWSSRITR